VQERAYAALVNVSGAGIGTGTSGITCAALSPPMLRVNPLSSASSLLLNKVSSKLTGSPAASGSPMPLPAAGAPLTQTQGDLIAAWITVVWCDGLRSCQPRVAPVTREITGRPR
jgi:hypothetical protein